MKVSETKSLDWVKVLSNEARLSDIILTEDLARKYRLPAASVTKALSRLTDRGLVSRIRKGIYLNKFVRDFAASDFVRILRPESYVSLESALNHWGLSTQSPVALTCVTTGKPREYRTVEFAIVFRRISRELFWGFIEQQTRYTKYSIAEPEKALLDWVYLTLQEGLTPRLDEISFKLIERQKLGRYAAKYPKTVRTVIAHSIAFEDPAA